MSLLGGCSSFPLFCENGAIYVRRGLDAGRNLAFAARPLPEKESVAMEAEGKIPIALYSFASRLNRVTTLTA